MLYRRADLEDVVGAHVLALERAASLGFARYIISATTPFTRDDLQELAHAPAVVRRRWPQDEAVYASLGWRMFPTIDRVYMNERARIELGWTPQSRLRASLGVAGRGRACAKCSRAGDRFEGYHDETFVDGPYPVDDR